MKEKNGEHPFGDAGQLILLFIFLAVWVTDSFFLGLTTMIASHVHPALRLSVGGSMLLAGILIARAGHVVVSGPERPDHVLKDGIFGYIRHPLYLASKLFYLGLFHMTFSIASLVVMIAASLFYNYIAGYEERLLIGRFGAEYEEYMETTGKWFPLLGRNRK